MANTKSALKAIRSQERKRKRNVMTLDKAKEARKAVRDAVTAGEKKEAIKLLPEAVKRIDKAAKAKIYHKNAAARYKGRLSKLVSGME